MRIRQLRNICVTLLLSTFMVGCASESHQSVATYQPKVSAVSFSGKKIPVSIGKFENRSPYMRGIFTDGVDRLGNQAKTILIAQLNQSGRFNVLDRENLVETKEEAVIANKAQTLKAAKFVVTGDVTEFGRKETGDHQFFGIIGQGKKQTAYAKVTLNVVNVKTSEVAYSAQGAGEYVLSNREIVGFGGSASYDSTLNGKVLDLAVREAIDNLVKSMEHGNN